MDDPFVIFMLGAQVVAWVAIGIIQIWSGPPRDPRHVALEILAQQKEKNDD